MTFFAQRSVVGTNGARVVSQLPASSLYEGYAGSNPQLIGTQTGFSATVVNALGGGLSEVAVRVTLEDGDSGLGEFDRFRNTLLLNGYSIGDFSSVTTQNTSSDGLTVFSTNTSGGFRNDILDTGFFYSNNPAFLANLYSSLNSSHEIKISLNDTNFGDNFYNFKAGVDGGLINVGQAPNVDPVINSVINSGPINEGNSATVTVNASDPDHTAGGLTYEFDFNNDNAYEVSNSTGTASHPFADNGFYPVKVRVSDARGGQVVSSTTVAVTNVAPTASIIGAPTTSPEGTTIGLTSSVSDPGADTFTYAWSVTKDGNPFALPVGTPANGAGFSFTPTDNGSYIVTLTVTDDDGGSTATGSSVLLNGLSGGVTDFEQATTAMFTPVTASKLTFDTTGYAHSHGGLMDYFVEVHDAGTGQWVEVHRGTLNGGQMFLFDDLVINLSPRSIDQVRINSDPFQGNSYHGWGQFLLTVSGTPQAAITVNNVAPTIGPLSLSNSSVAEDGTVTVTGSFTDPGTLDTHTAVLNWGDGTTSAATVNPLTRTFTASHQYLDDGTSPGNGTASDPYTITATITDDDSATGTASTNITINNVAPSNLVLNGGTIDENGVFSLNGSFADSGTLDVHSVTVNWGAGEGSSTIVLPVGQRSFSLTHQYLDDNPTGTPLDDYTLSVTLNDDDGGQTGPAAMAATIASWAGPSQAARFQPGSENFVEDGRYVEAFWAVNLGSPSGTITGGHFHGPNTESQHFNGSNQLQGFLIESADGSPFSLVSLDYRVVNTGSIDGFSPANVQVLIGTSLNPQAAVASQFTGFATVSGSSFTTLPITGFTNVTRVFISSSASVEFDNIAIVGSNAVTIHVNNVAPTVSPLSLSAPSIDENGSVTVTGSFTDPGTLDTHTAVINWGDGTTSAAVVDPLNRTFTATHQYLDDGVSPGNGSASDLYTITATVTDDDTGSASASTSVTVHNFAPSALVLNSGTIAENGTFTLNGAFTDLGSRDVHTVAINWQDGSPVTTLTLAAGVLTFSASHQYLDDGPNPGNGTISDVYSVGVTVTDDDTGSVAASTSVTVTNVTPSIASISVTPSINENGTATLSGIYTDVGTLDTHTLMINWGEGAPQTVVVSGGTFSFTHQYLDDNPTSTSSNIYTISVQVADDDLGTSTATTRTITVNNVAPSVASANFSSTSINEDGSVTVSGTVSDVGTLDVLTVTIAWDAGEGTTTLLPSQLTPVVGQPGVYSYTATHQYLDDNPNGTASDVYTILVTVADDDLGTSTATTQAIIVNNVAPQNVNAGADQTVNEGATVNLSGSFTDPGSADTHSLTWSVTASNGQVISNGSGASFSFVPNDNGTYTVTFTVVDDDLASTSDSTVITVNNVAPQSVNAGADQTVNEGDSVSLVGSFTDPGSADTHTLSWSVTSDNGQTVAGGSGASFSFVPNDNGTYTVTFTVVDDDLASISDSTVITVNNVAPQNVNAGADQTVNEGDTVLLSGSFTDPGSADTHSLTWSVTASNGQVISNGSGASFSFVPNDNGTYTVTFTVVDDDLASISDSTVITVDNVNPSAIADSGTTAAGSPVLVNVRGNDTDLAGVNDPLTVTSVTQGSNGTVTNNGDGTVTYTPDSTFSGMDSFTYTISDGDGGISTATVTINVTPSAPGSVLTVVDTCMGGTALLITGTGADDLIRVEPGSTASTLTVKVNGVSRTVPKPTGRIIILGGDGDDDIQIAGSLSSPAWLYGEAGNDKLNAGGGNSLVIGGDGDDQMNGGSGRDVMIGGNGADKMVGNAGDDLLIAGYTINDGRSVAGHEEFYCDVLMEWASSHLFSTRVQNLRLFLLPDVRDDGDDDEVDFLQGSSGNDWLIFASGEDKVAGQTEAGDSVDD